MFFYSLNGYRIFHEKTTHWCPDREEHGYFLTPLYKCSTKPRVPTAHQWSEVDPRCRMTSPTGERIIGPQEQYTDMTKSASIAERVNGTMRDNTSLFAWMN